MTTQTTQRTSVEALRRELQLRFEDEQFHDPQGASELLSEMVLDPVKDAAKFPLFFQERLSRDKKPKGVCGRAAGSLAQRGFRPSLWSHS